MPFSPIPDIVEELNTGKPIVLVDDEDRENEGDIVYAAEKITPAVIRLQASPILVTGNADIARGSYSFLVTTTLEITSASVSRRPPRM